MLLSDILVKKRLGHELTWEEIEFFVKGLNNGTVKDVQKGALIMAYHLNGTTDVESELFMKAMVFSGVQLTWPKAWVESMVYLHSTGTTGNKVRMLLGAAMAACGLKMPVLPARGLCSTEGVVNKLLTIPGYNGDLNTERIKTILKEVGTVVALQPAEIAPAERVIRDTAAIITTFDDYGLQAACVIARLVAMRIHAVVIEVTCGPGEQIKTREDARKMVDIFREQTRIMGIKSKIVLTHVDGLVGSMIGQSLELAELFKVVNGEGPQDLLEVLYRLGGHMLHAAGQSATPIVGQQRIAKTIRDGTMKKKLSQMLQAQGVEKQDVKSLLKIRRDENAISPVLPVPQYYTHLCAEDTGFVHNINVTLLNQIMYDVADATEGFAGGIHITASVGAYLNRGEVWAKVYHKGKLLEDHLIKIREAITLKLDPPLFDMVIDMQEAPSTEKLQRLNGHGYSDSTIPTSSLSSPSPLEGSLASDAIEDLMIKEDTSFESVPV